MDTFDLVWMQVLTGGTEVIETGISADKALAHLTEMNKIAPTYGMGSVFYLAPSDDPLHQVRKELARARALCPLISSAPEAYAAIFTEFVPFKDEALKEGDSDAAAMRAALIKLAATALRAIGDLQL